MDMVAQFFITFKDYFLEVLPFLAIGLFLSGLVNEFVPTGWVERHLGGRGIKPLLYATIAGTILPICCIGALPVAVSLHQKGARLGPVLAFLVATPATSITALLVSYSLLGIKFTAFL
ncbi:MAG: permease, partial [Dehalococcoidales bacterium]|nr:permease [Dehalococcoidales bacterium]